MTGILGNYKHAKLGVLIILIFSLSQFSKWSEHTENPLYQFTSDVASYYSYLPSFFLNDDVKMKQYVQPAAGMVELENGGLMPKYTYGMAVLYSPFFFLAELFSDDNEEFAQFGVTRTHSLFNKIGTILVVCLGFFLLMIVLTKYFSKISSLITVLLIYFGTNLTHYTLVEGAFPHSYLFTLFAAVIFYSDRYWSGRNNKDLYILAFLCGFITLTRSPEGIIILVPFLWGVYTLSDLKDRFRFIISKWKSMMISALIFLIPIVPYFFYLKYMTGEYFYYAYGNENFFLFEPRIGKFLFGFRKGWFIYTPLMFLALIGFFLRMKNGKRISPVFYITIAIAIYLMSSWWCWWFGGSFGNRSMIQYYTLMAFPLAALIDFVINKRFLKVLTALGLVLCLGYNALMTKKYHDSQLHWDSMTYDAFVYTLTHIPFKDQAEYDEFFELLDPPDYKKAENGEER